MTCTICHEPTRPLFQHRVLGKYDATYQYCASCDHVFAEHPYWLEEAYSEAIATTDTDIAVRNNLTALRLAAIYYAAFGESGDGIYADIAGGYGLLTRLMRDFGFNYYWSDQYANNLFARGFEYEAGLGPCTAITAMEVIEHTANPLAFIQQNLDHCQSDTMLFTMEVFPDGCPPAPGKWGYYAFDTGQHIAFFSAKGLAHLGQRLGLKYLNLGRIHIFTRRDLSLFRLKLASNKALIIPLAMVALRRLGSKRGPDQTMLLKKLRGIR